MPTLPTVPTLHPKQTLAASSAGASRTASHPQEQIRQRQCRKGRGNTLYLVHGGDRLYTRCCFLHSCDSRAFLTVCASCMTGRHRGQQPEHREGLENACPDSLACPNFFPARARITTVVGFQGGREDGLPSLARPVMMRHLIPSQAAPRSRFEPLDVSRLQFGGFQKPLSPLLAPFSSAPLFFFGPSSRHP